MDIKEAFAKALKLARNYCGLTQEAFSDVSSRTYISTLERGLKNPTLEKIDILSKVMGIHPLTLLTLTYQIETGDPNPSDILHRVNEELKKYETSILLSSTHKNLTV